MSVSKEHVNLMGAPRYKPIAGTRFKVSMRIPSTFNGKLNAAAAVIGILLSLGTIPVGAQENGSLESIWIDHADKSDKPQAQESAPDTNTVTTPDAAPSTATAAPAKTVITNSSSNSTALDTVAPLCSLNDFKTSALVSKGGWPGVGPFHVSEGASGEFTDEQQNRITLSLDGEKITRAELSLSGKPSATSSQNSLLDIQMHADFLLEAVGIKPSRIQELNKQLEKEKEALKSDGAQLNFTVGRHSVTVEKHAPSFLIAINSLDANQNVIKQHALPESTQAAVPSTDQTSHKPATATPAVNQAALKSQFVDLINSWQRVKKQAVRTKQADGLSSVLAGKALANQSIAVKWLAANHKYYDMNPHNIVVDQFTEISSKKYLVAAQVHEAYKFIDEPTGKVIKEVNDVNKVTYTIEKVSGKWLITDSAVLSTSAKASSNNKTH